LSEWLLWLIIRLMTRFVGPAHEPSLLSNLYSRNSSCLLLI
jgi:hypothetical protein